jgi:hypothetical protein
VGSTPADVLELLGPPPLFSTEDANLYNALVARLAQSVQPRDLITWMLIKDLADHRVEMARYRRIKAGLLERPYQRKVAVLVSRLEITLRDQPDELRKAAEKKRQSWISQTEPQTKSKRSKRISTENSREISASLGLSARNNLRV